MAKILEAEACESDTENKKKCQKQKGKEKAQNLDLDDNTEYISSQSESDNSSDEGEESDKVEISNQEVCPILYLHMTLLNSFQLADSLPLKTIPAGKKRLLKVDGKRPKQPKKCQCKSMDYTEDDVPPPASTSQASTSKKV